MSKYDALSEVFIGSGKGSKDEISLELSNDELSKCCDDRIIDMDVYPGFPYEGGIDIKVCNVEAFCAKLIAFAEKCKDPNLKEGKLK